jgi:hypothetical protein
MIATLFIRRQYRSELATGKFLAGLIQETDTLSLTPCFSGVFVRPGPEINCFNSFSITFGFCTLLNRP